MPTNLTLLERVVKSVLSEDIHDKLKSSQSISLKGKRQWVNKRLDDNDNDKYDHAQLAYYLWADKDKDSARSYFSKCVKGTRRFSDDDIKKLYIKMKKG